MAKSGTKIKRIKANEPKEVAKPVNKKDIAEVKEPKISKYAAKMSGAKAKKTKKRNMPKILYIILLPAIKLCSYLRASWKEIKLVRWPNRRETWKMTGSVILFSAFFAILILCLDVFFEWVFKLIIGK